MWYYVTRSVVLGVSEDRNAFKFKGVLLRTPEDKDTTIPRNVGQN